MLERRYRDCCDIEFTIEQGRLWLLQVRVGKRTPQAAVRMAVEMAEAQDFPLDRDEAVRRVLAHLADPPRAIVESGDGETALARGLGASPGLVSGEIRLTPEDAVAGAEAGRDVILVRAETSPDDVHGMQRSCGILTSCGGFASHAAVVARGWGIPAVVGASDVVIGQDGVVVGGHPLAAGSVITIDGSSGEIFEGVKSGVEAVVPEAKTLLGWARELGIAIPGASEDGDPTADAGGMGNSEPVATGADDALRVLLIKGYCLPAAMATALGCGPEEASSLVDGLVEVGRAEPGAGAFRLTADGKAAATALIAADSVSWGDQAATTALDAFVALDQRMKEIVTAWQMKDADTLNDHGDPAYDAAVLARLGELHADVDAWLAPLVAGLPRLGRYGNRLQAAAAAAAAGDGRYIASPRVDSYHGVWFELHEDLIQLAGRTRADEVAAGRA